MKEEKGAGSDRSETIQTAQDILTGKTGIIEGSRIIKRLLWESGVSEYDEVYLTFAAIDSETDALPVGEERQCWSVEALKEKDALIREAEDLYRQTAIDACESIIKRWKETV